MVSRFSMLLFCGAIAAVTSQAGAPLRAVSLHTVLTEIAREVGGAEIEVTGLVRPGTDPHLFEPSPADMRRLGEADLVLAAGLGLETYLPQLAGQVAKERLIEVGGRLPNPLKSECQHGHGDQHSAHAESDPHWWQSIAAVVTIVEVVELEFTRIRPAGAASFKHNAAAYRERLLALQQWARQEVALIPPARRHLVTTHDAFGYLARDFGFTVHPLLGVSTAEEASARHVGSVIDLIKQHQIKAVFADVADNARLIEMLVRDTGVKQGGALYADGLGVEEAATYEAMVRHNLTQLVKALR
jgi:zinc/manganese transport system substrate-binding protein